jgi:release factor glutamine methyltransferase
MKRRQETSKGIARRPQGEDDGSARAVPTLIEAVKMAEGYLAGIEVDSPRLSAEHLLAKVIGCERLDLYLRFDERMTVDALAAYRDLLKLRAGHYPLQYILGSTEFCSLSFETSEGVFIPRPETELLVEWIEEIFEARENVTFIEFGVGSGVIAGALARRNEAWKGSAFDRSCRAAKLAGRNISSLGVSDRVGLFVAESFDAVGAGPIFDLLVSNPPYIPTSDIPGLQKEVSLFENPVALDGGTDGLGYYPQLAEAGARLLRPGGTIALEIGDGQGDGVMEILEAAGYRQTFVKRDYNGLERLVAAFRPGY